MSDITEKSSLMSDEPCGLTEASASPGASVIVSGPQIQPLSMHDSTLLDLPCHFGDV